MKNKEKSKKKIIAAAERVKEKEYWLNRLSGELEKSHFPYDGEKKTVGERSIDTTPFKFTGELFTRLWQISKKSDYTLNIVLQAVLFALLKKYTGSSDIVVGTVIYKQENKGDYINTVLALRNQPGDRITFKELLLQVRQTLVEACENQNYPIEVLADQLNMSNPRDRDFPLFDVAIFLENIHDKSCLQPVAHNMTFSFLRTDESVEGVLKYTTSLYCKSTIERIITNFSRLLHEAILNVDARVSSINILSEEETRQLLTVFNETAAAYPRDRAIHHLFEEQMETNPDRIAVAGMTGGKQGRHLQATYKELNEKSNQLARLLIQKGIRPENIVGIMVERSIEMITGMLGILKAGGAYMPIEPEYPVERIQYMLTDSSAKLLVTTTGLSGTFEKLPIADCQLLMVNEKPPGGGRLYTTPKEANLAYVIYTSGSTGRPKGVLLEHRGVVRLVYKPNYIDFVNSDKLLLTGPFVFDITTFEIWAPLLNRVALYLVQESVVLEVGRLENALHKYGITIMHLIAQLFSRVALERPEVFSRLKYLLVGGDLVRSAHVNQVRNQYQNLEILHMYGPTENTTFSTFFPVNQDHETRIPLGKPIGNSTVYILDKNNCLQPLGVTGELVTGGDGVARGYLNNPELTAEKFIKLEFKVNVNEGEEPREQIPGFKSRIPKKHMSYIYKTGDRARWLADGNIEFLGRIDLQVKIMGFRVETGEIESQLLKHEKINEAAVIVQKDNNENEKYLCAYIVPHSLETLNTSELREYLSGELPYYMIPNYFVQVKSIPLTANGKVDRRKLHTIKGELLGLKGTYVAPNTELEKLIVKTWGEVLGVTKIGMHDNFFELGGNSLRVMHLNSRLNQILERDIPVVELFKYQTIRSFISYLNQDQEGVKESPGIVAHSALIEKAKQRQKIQQTKRKGKIGNVRDKKRN